MRSCNYVIYLIVFALSSCDSGKLTVLADLPMRITESSAAEFLPNVPLLWTIQDRGNAAEVYGLDKSASIKKLLKVTNAKNHDWEDLTSDSNGNLYIGDFGNNHKDRKEFTIYKLARPENESSEIQAETIQFKLPKNQNSEDFEAFFLWKGHFYIFSKNQKKGIVVKVPNKIGIHTAKILDNFELKGTDPRITSADISDDGKSIVLLTHDKLYLITDFIEDDFFNGTVETIFFNHDSQKEGIVFSEKNKVIITDEKNSSFGGNVYSLEW